MKWARFCPSATRPSARWWTTSTSLSSGKNALSPDRPIIRGTAQNPDVFFQAREACNPFHAAVPGIVQSVMDRFAAQTGRAYHLFDYYGAPDAERVIVLMGSGAEAAEEAVDLLNKQGEKLGLVKVRLYRPFDASAFLSGAAGDGEVDCRSRPLQGAGRNGRAALSGHCDGAGRECRACRSPSSRR